MYGFGFGVRVDVEGDERRETRDGRRETGEGEVWGNHAFARFPPHTRNHLAFHSMQSRSYPCSTVLHCTALHCTVLYSP